MRSLHDYMIAEAVKKLPENVTGLIVCDIDDTLLVADTNKIGIYKNKPGEPEKYLSTDEFAKDPDAETHIEWFNFREFRDHQKVYQSIVSGTPVIKNLKIVDAYVNAGYDFCFLTARGCEETVKRAIGDFMEIRKPNGALEKLGDEYRKAISHAVNDDDIKYPGNSDAERKGKILRDLCSKYDRVVFVDDDRKNVEQAKALGIKNLTVITAWGK